MCASSENTYRGPKTVYRLLRENENPNYGISAKLPSSNQSVWGHVKHGSKGKSHFISTSLTYNALYPLVDYKKKVRPNADIKIVKIDLERASSESSIKVTDLTKMEERRKHIRHGHDADRLARMYQEVLIEGRIPPSAVSVIYDGPIGSCPVSEPGSGSGYGGNPCNTPEVPKDITLSDGQRYHRYRCYNRSTAHFFCETQGYRLLRVESQNELDQIKSISIIQDTDPDIWTDQIVRNDILQYTDGTPATFYPQKDDGCYFLEQPQGYRIKETRCDEDHHSICEGGPYIYSYVKLQHNWREAKSSCEGSGLKLAIVNSSSQLLFIQQWIQSGGATQNVESVWIGLTISGGYIRTSDDVITSYLPSHHDNHGCISMDINQDFSFKRGQCHDLKDFICEASTEYTTERDQSSMQPSTSSIHTSPSPLETEPPSIISTEVSTEHEYSTPDMTTHVDITSTEQETGTTVVSVTETESTVFPSVLETGSTPIISTEYEHSTPDTTTYIDVTSEVPETEPTALSQSDNTVSLNTCVKDGYLIQNYCVCYNYTLTKEELSEKLKEIKSILTLEKSTLSLFKRQKTCANDDRKSATVTGSIGAVILCLIILCIVVPDIVGLILYLLKHYCNKVQTC